ncbi:MAG: MerR family transcriptional regulator [Desulfobacter sp.]|nr:MAG: MerR family transcriptional regulator [Desulfobacter sp.]
MRRPKDFSIGDTAKITGVTPKQLRNWEQRGYIQGVERVVCGERAYRRFKESHVRQIIGIKEYLKEGYTLPAAAAKSIANPGKGEK